MMEYGEKTLMTEISFPTWRVALFFYMAGAADVDGIPMGMWPTHESMLAYLEDYPEMENQHNSVRPAEQVHPADMNRSYDKLRELGLLKKNEADATYRLTTLGYDVFIWMDDMDWREWPVETTTVISPLADGEDWS